MRAHTLAVMAGASLLAVGGIADAITVPDWGTCASGTGTCFSISTNDPNADAIVGIAHSGRGVYGQSSYASGVLGTGYPGVYGSSSGSGTQGVYGYNGQYGDGVYGYSGTGYGVHGASGSGVGVAGTSTGYAYGMLASSTGTGAALYATTSGAARAVDVLATGTGLAVNAVAYGATAVTATATGASGAGVEGYSYNWAGVYGHTRAPVAAVYGYCETNSGGYGVAGRIGPTSTGQAVLGDAQRQSNGCLNGGYSGCAGYFSGNVSVNGSFYALAKNFVIDHPVDPAHKVLVHASIEAPEMMNVYSGNVTLDGHGEAWVDLPAYFEALNKDFRYQLTNIGGFAPTYVAEKVKDNRFKIAGGMPGMEVSWQVTGVRHDAYAEDHPMVVENEKAPQDRDKYYYSRNQADPRLGPPLPSQPEDAVVESLAPASPLGAASLSYQQ